MSGEEIGDHLIAAEEGNARLPIRVFQRLPHTTPLQEANENRSESLKLKQKKKKKERERERAYEACWE